MSDPLDLQNEEREVLSSIYDGDECFKQISPTIYQYRYGQNDEYESFLLELEWVDKYPDEQPKFNMDLFYNKHISDELKNKIAKILSDEAEQYLGMSMTYTLFEFLKERFEELIKEQPEKSVDMQISEKLNICDLQGNVQTEEDKKVPKKEQLTKAQKRRQWNKLDSKGEKPRGWNWVDIVKHLSQTGSKVESASTS